MMLELHSAVSGKDFPSSLDNAIGKCKCLRSRISSIITSYQSLFFKRVSVKLLTGTVLFRLTGEPSATVR